MTRKRYMKLMRATMIECYRINEANGGNPYSAKQVEDNLRNLKIAPGKSYAECWESINACLKGIVSTCK